MAEFSPRQLDQLEDALDDLEEIDELASLELSPELTERLGEYQEVVALCREAFPLETPADDVLADVLAEAHAVSRHGRQPQVAHRGWRRLWDRWRGMVIPGLALAGTTAAVLWLLEPDTQLDRGDELAMDLSESDERKGERDSEGDRADRARGDAPSEPASEPSLDDESAAELEQPETESKIEEAGEVDTNEGADSGAGDSTPRKKARSKRSSPAPAVAPAPPPEPLTKDDAWTKLGSADSARRLGNCSHARKLYKAVIAASTDANAVAQARAGVGLCLEQDRRKGEAAQWYEDARAQNPGIDAWIERERDEQPLPGEKSSRPVRSKKSAMETDAL